MKRSKPSLKFGDPIKLTWVDAVGVNHGWREPYTDGVLVENVGLFVLKNKNGMCIAKGVVPNDKTDVLEPTWIPKGMIRKIRKLR